MKFEEKTLKFTVTGGSPEMSVKCFCNGYNIELYENGNFICFAKDKIDALEIADRYIFQRTADLFPVVTEHVQSEVTTVPG